MRSTGVADKAVATEAIAGGRGRARPSGGQILVIYVMSIVVIIGLMGLVIDVAWYWSSSLRVQRAADAAALAGAVDLPAKPGTAASHAIGTAIGDAIAEAAKNGYTTLPFGCAADGVTPSSNPGICVRVDTGNTNQLDVKISAPVNTFFMRLFGISTLTASRDAAAIFTLPVPMGSPDAYYGVGNFEVNGTTRQDFNSKSGTTTAQGTGWTNPGNAGNTASLYATTKGDGSSNNATTQQWSFGNYSPAIGASLDGVQVVLNAKVSSAGTGCTVGVDLSWNSGSTWDNGAATLTPSLTTSDQTGPAYYTLGSATSTSWLGTNHTWAVGDFSGTTMRVRLTYTKGTCGTVSVNNLAVVVSSHTDTTTATVTKDGSGNAGLFDGATFMQSRGAWGAIITKGGDQGNGDAYAPANNTGYTPSNNVKYDPNGYNYIVNLPAGGTVKVFDPGFCAMGSNGNGGNLGTGDHWIGTVGKPVSTYYTLWDTNGRPDLPAVWTEVYTSGTLFQGETGFDPANATKNAASGTLSGATSGCNSNGTDTYHNAWWTMPTVPAILGAGSYAVQVQTTKTAHFGVAADATQNQSTNAENMFAIEAVGTSSPQAYGNGRMTVYNNLPPSSPPQQFYLAQIDQRTGAGKTALIDLFDPGDLSTAAGSNGTLQVLSPDGGTPHVVNFNYTMDNYPTTNCKTQVGTSPCSGGTNVSQIVTTWNGAQATNNTWIHIAIPLPTTYGQTLWNNGWWQIQYTTTQGASDTTTWQVSVTGNPVHLVVP